MQLLLIGDLMQLAPVVTPQDLEILGDYYPTPYFFASKALARTQFYTIGLEKIYRQTDAQFIGILNQVRTGRASAETLDKLNSRCDPGFAPKESEGYIRMTTHVKAAEDINEEKLQALKAEAHHYESRVAGDFLRHQASVASHNRDRYIQPPFFHHMPHRFHKLGDQRDQAGIQHGSRTGF